MSKKLLIDAAHPEETRVALVDENNRLTEYDIETSNKETIKGNIYLAKIMRVEPSLQAAFVDYGGNRHGFLAFSEIHPDYFRIPVSDREALEAKLAETLVSEEEPQDAEVVDTKDAKKETDVTDKDSEGDQESEPQVSTIAGESVDHSDEDHSEDARKRRPPLHKMYKIQEVIHKNQIVLIQVTKEERGQKGAALTTYMSLAGRYCVLMPNSPQAGGISRKISNAADRKSLRESLAALDLPKEMGLIIRTAGQGRTKTEIKRDTDYLTRQWDEIRAQTLKSIAPSLIYQEDSIIKRVIRDQYSKDISEILVAGEECHKSAKAFMKKLLPSHAKNVQLYDDAKAPLFIKHKIEEQIEKMHQSTVMLPSGGSIVINPTEALVSIDINSGKATRERHISQTAFNTNIEAAAEIARQVRLRDLAGLVVIDFIDMDDRKYISQVERKVRESFKNDRARVQMGKISPFGLLELSRQRLRPSMLETSSQPCPHCHATGHIRSTESMALLVLRSLEEEGMANRSSKLKAVVPTEVAFYILNYKRQHLADIEARHEIIIIIEGDHSLIAPTFKLMQLERKGGGTPEKPEADVRRSNRRGGEGRSRNRTPTDKKPEDVKPKDPKEGDDTSPSDEKKEGERTRKPRRRGRRGGGGGNASRDNVEQKTGETQDDSAATESPKGEPKPDVAQDATPSETPRTNSRRRGPRRRSGGRSQGPSNNNSDDGDSAQKSEAKSDVKSEPKIVAAPAEKPAAQTDKPAPKSDEKPKSPRARKSWLKKLLE